MGRSKVPDSERRRATRACTLCRAAKKKCSASIPCTYCRQRGLAASCFVTNNNGRQSSKETNSLSNDQESLSISDSPVQNAQYHADIVPGATHSGYQEGQPSVRGDGALAGMNLSKSPSGIPVQIESQRRASDDVNVGEEPIFRPRLLLNLQGEQVYIGQAASLSFLQLVREIVAEQIGPSQFSHNEATENMLEIESPVAIPIPIPSSKVQLDYEQMLSFSQTFKSSLDGLVSIFAPSEINGLLLHSNETHVCPRNPYKKATIDMIIAIGAQCQSQKSSVEVGQVFFRRAQQLASSEILEDPSVDMVRVFLLMAFYMLGSCRRNAAFMYIGIAVRAAVTLGLHSRDSYGNMSLLKFQLRLRIWMSVCILDMIVGAILGRPPATAALRSDLDNELEEMSAVMRNSEMDLGILLASYKILSVISDIVDKLYKRKAITGAIVEEYLDKIEHWKREYGSSVSVSSTLDSAMLSTGCEIGKIHVSCLYYFGVTLVTRPILIPTLIGQSGSYGPTGSQMAQACVDAATYLVQTCVDALEAGVLLGNMCILKALLFISGLILGLQSFRKRHIDYDVETAFLGAQRTLEFLAVQSPQAAHYLDILSLLSTAIIRQREAFASARKSRYVTRLVSLDKPRPEADTGQQHESTLPHRIELETSSAIGIAAEPTIAPLVAEPLFVGSEGETLYNWDHFDITQWDDFLQFAANNQETTIDVSHFV